MADMTLAQIGEVSGGGSPQAPVSQPSGTAAALQFAQGVGETLFQAVGERRAAEQEAQTTAAVEQFARRQMEIADAVDRGDLSSQEGRMRMRANLSRAGADNLGMQDAFAEAHRTVITTAGMGKVAAEGTAEEQAFLKIQEEAMKTGWVTQGMTPEEARANTYQFIKFNRSQEMINAQQNQLALERAQIGKQSDIVQLGTARISQQQARLNLAETEAAIESRHSATVMADAYTTRMLTKFNEIEAAVENGQMDENEAARLMQNEWLEVQNTVQEAGRLTGSNDLENIVAPMRRIFETKVGYVTGEFDRGVMEERINSNLTATKLNLLNDPELSGTVAVSQLVGQGGSLALTQPLTMAARNAVEMVSKNMGRPEGGDEGVPIKRPADITDPSQSEAIGSYLGMVDNALKKRRDGTLVGGDAAETEIQNNLNNMLRGLGSYGDLVDNPQDLNQAVSFFAGESYARYIEDGATGISPEYAERARSVLRAKYDEVVRPLIAEEWRNAETLTMEVFDPARPETAGRTEAVSGLIRPVFTGKGVSFMVREGAKDPRLPRKVDDLNRRVAPPLNRLIRAGAHLELHTDYQRLYEQNYAQLLGDAGTGAAAQED